MKQLRLLKVIVQPVFVIDDGESLSEETGNTLSVPASQWKEFATETFDREVQRIQNDFNLQQE